VGELQKWVRDSPGWESWIPYSSSNYQLP